LCEVVLGKRPGKFPGHVFVEQNLQGCA
jgi:hypothetical protein